jgi:rhodanese-related sulfurtransferase
LRKASLRAVVLLLGAVAVAAGCQKRHENVKEIAVPEAAAARQGDAVFVDANNDDFRKSNGKVPGAILLASYREYSPERVLPGDKERQLVFYCASKT